MKPNGHDAPPVVGDRALLAEADGASEGAHAIRRQLDHMRLAAQASARTALLHTQHQIEIARWRHQADQAQAILVDCLQRADHDGAAQATRALTIACLHLIRLGAE